jgi:hypothetical protein
VTQRSPEHRAALEEAVLAQFTTAASCDGKANRPAGPEVLAEAARLLGADARNPVRARAIRRQPGAASAWPTWRV